jgi:hypothetical protein
VSNDKQFRQRKMTVVQICEKVLSLQKNSRQVAESKINANMLACEFCFKEGRTTIGDTTFPNGNEWKQIPAW